MPTVDQVDIQGFISKFSQQLEKPKTKGKGKKEAILDPAIVTIETPASTVPYVDQVLLQRSEQKLRNEYESKLMERDGEIRRLQGIMSNAAKILTNGTGPLPGTPVQFLASGNLELWLGKLKNGGAGRILRFLADHPGTLFTRSQIGLALGIKSTTGSFSTYMSTLRANKLIIERDNESQVNPDL